MSIEEGFAQALMDMVEMDDLGKGKVGHREADDIIVNFLCEVDGYEGETDALYLTPEYINVVAKLCELQKAVIAFNESLPISEEESED